jgi:hypothetical protein
MPAPATYVALALAVFGLGSVAAAFLGEGFALARLVLGLALLGLALLVAGAQALLAHAAPTNGGET